MNEMKLKYCKVRNVKDPCRAHSDDAGIDFFVPDNLDKEELLGKNPKLPSVQIVSDCSTQQPSTVKEIVLNPGDSVLIPSGIHVKIPKGYALVYMNKSGVATKKNLQVGACVVDECYEGECHLHLTNIGNKIVEINAGDKIVQGVVLPINYCMPEAVDSLDALYADSNSTRGAGGFGSSGAN